MIGRHEESMLLRRLMDSDEAEFVVVYGRRRVGKTYLVKETFGEFFFTYTGAANVTRDVQLREFTKALKSHGWHAEDTQSEPTDWFRAFDALRSLIERSDEAGKLVIFLDEMPWMDNKKSDFVPALEHWWNSWASGRKNLMLVVCGSAASWITKKIFRNRGGLYNRVTRQILLKPFTLGECKEYLDSRNVVINNHDLIESYMIFGGIPYYLRMIDRKYSLALNVDKLCFADDAPLGMEYNMLFDTLFSTPDRHREVCEAINSKKVGMTREEIAHTIDFGNGGNLTRILDELTQSGFLRKYKPYGKKRNGALYMLCDPFVSFHLNFIQDSGSNTLWSSFIDNARHRAWSGYAFEQVCLAHIDKIKQALGISGILTGVSAWKGVDDDGEGAQVDLVIDRSDGIINLCEMKYSNSEYTVDKKEDLALRNKAGIFQRVTGTKKGIHLTLVTSYGLKLNAYSGVFQSQVTMDDLIRS